MKRLITVPIIIMLTISVWPSVSVQGQQDKLANLTERVIELETIVSQLQHRIAELEDKILLRQTGTQPLIQKGDWKNISSWRRLRRGMTMDQVKILLGEPQKVDVGVMLIFWYWGYLKPGSGQVTFDIDTDRLSGWSEPSR